MDISISKLNEYVADFDLNFSDSQLDKFSKYYDLLISWNEKMNLTAITEFDEVLKKHFLDSMGLILSKKSEVCVDIISDILNNKKVSLLDVGCGAGFPSIPLKIAFPNLQITMLDSLNKRISFLNEVISSLNLDGIEAIHGRAEDFATKEKLRESFDIVTSRAVANLSTLSEYCLPYVKEEGLFIPYKAELLEEELLPGKKAISILGGKFISVIEYDLPYTDFHRSLIVVKKVKATPNKYPRKAGLPSKEPLCK